MASLNMRGPYELTNEKIDEIVTITSPGNYALGYEEDDKFHVQYVGRADSDLKDRLKQHVSEDYGSFKYSYATSPKAAFEKECKNYHEFGGSQKLRNKIHPDRPKGANWKCPICEFSN